MNIIFFRSKITYYTCETIGAVFKDMWVSCYVQSVPPDIRLSNQPFGSESYFTQSREKSLQEFWLNLICVSCTLEFCL